MFRTKTKPVEPTPKWSLLQVPDQYLTKEERSEQSAYQKSVAILKSSDGTATPAGAEINLVLEIAALRAFFKLGSKTFPYQQLLDAMKAKDVDKVFEFISHNVGIIQAVEEDSGPLLIFRKPRRFSWDHDYCLQGICPSALISKILEKQNEHQEKRKKDLEEVEKESKDEYMEVIIEEKVVRNETVLQDDQGRNDNDTDGTTDNTSNASNYSSARIKSQRDESVKNGDSGSNDGDITKKMERIKAETKQTEKNSISTRNRNKVQEFEKEMRKLMAGIGKKEEEVPVRNGEKEGGFKCIFERLTEESSTGNDAETRRINTSTSSTYSEEHAKLEKVLVTMRKSREMLEEENEIRMKDGLQRLQKIKEILKSGNVILFVVNFNVEELQEVLEFLKNKRITSIDRIVEVNKDAELRLGIKEYTNCETFSQLIINGVLEAI